VEGEKLGEDGFEGCVGFHKNLQVVLLLKLIKSVININ
jgi:hypothetical protein